MRAIDVIVADYQARKDQHIDIPEWIIDGKPLRIHWNLLTIEQRKDLTKADRSDVDVVVRMALDDAGVKMFDLADKQKLKLQADATIITRIAMAMLGQGQVSDSAVEDAAKN